MECQLYKFHIMKKLLEPCQILISYYYYCWANSRMSSKTLPVAPVLENAHIHKLLFKCSKTCSKSVRERADFVLPICIVAKGRQSSLWPKATRLYKRAIQKCLVRFAGTPHHGYSIEFQIFGHKLKKVI